MREAKVEEEEERTRERPESSEKTLFTPFTSYKLTPGVLQAYSLSSLQAWSAAPTGRSPKPSLHCYDKCGKMEMS